MIRLLASAVVATIANAIALVVGALVLPEFSLGKTGFVIAVLIFTGTGVLIEPLLRQMAMKQLPVLLGSTALVSTLVGLIVTSLLTDSLSIDGLTTWLASVVIVWVVALVGRLLLPMMIFKKVLAERRG